MDTMVLGNSTLTQDENIGNKIQEVLAVLTSASFGVPRTLFGIFNILEDENMVTARSGCDDPFAIFGFLAFLLALLQLLVDSGSKKKKRSTGDCQLVNRQGGSRDREMREAALAVYSMIQGFLNSMDVRDGNMTINNFILRAQFTLYFLPVQELPSVSCYPCVKLPEKQQIWARLEQLLGRLEA